MLINSIDSIKKMILESTRNGTKSAMTPESIIKNTLEQLIQLNVPAAMIMVQGEKAVIFGKSETATLPLFTVPSSLLFSACNRIFQTNEYEKTKHFQFSPNNELRMVRFSNDLIYNSTRGHDITMTTSRLGKQRYQVLWYITLSHKKLRDMEQGINPFQDCTDQVFSDSKVNQLDEQISQDANESYEQLRQKAEESHKSYEEYLGILRLTNRENYSNEQLGVLSRGVSFLEPFDSVVEAHFHGINLKLESYGDSFFAPYIIPYSTRYLPWVKGTAYS